MLAAVLVALLLPQQSIAACLVGSEVAGSCWFLSAENESCETTCRNQGRSYDDATLTFAGSAGTFANCRAVLDALGARGDDLEDLPCELGGGCSYFPEEEERFRCFEPPTRADVASPGEQRACACYRSRSWSAWFVTIAIGLVSTALLLWVMSKR